MIETGFFTTFSATFRGPKQYIGWAYFFNPRTGKDHHHRGHKHRCKAVYTFSGGCRTIRLDNQPKIRSP
jgi:hypothetical protein